jgi:hypothetical protein
MFMMRLLNTKSKRLESFYNQPIPEYAILSHRWENEEITFQEINELSERDLQKRKGYWKIEKCCDQAKEENLAYAWVDTCCIDKNSSAELQESIGSMFQWYHNSKVCYAYLSDAEEPGEIQPVDGDPVQSSFRKSKWFTRGWTLQELIAPRVVRFFNANWREIGNKQQLSSIIQEITGVDSIVLQNSHMLSQFSVAARMSWAANRTTTRKEDIAYSLLGIFEIHIPLIYGEGYNAFIRLQEEVIRSMHDDSILAWDFDKNDETQKQFLEKIEDTEALGVLAKHPCFFKGKGNVRGTGFLDADPWTLTSIGIQIPRSSWVPRTTVTWDLKLSCYDDVKGQNSVYAFPLESTKRFDVFGRRYEALSTTVPQFRSTEMSILHEERIYLSKTDSPHRSTVDGPKSLQFPRKVNANENALHTKPFSFVLRSTVRTDVDNTYQEILDTELPGPEPSLSIGARDSMFILGYFVSCQGVEMIDSLFEVIIFSRYRGRKWCIHCRETKPSVSKYPYLDNQKPVPAILPELAMKKYRGVPMGSLVKASLTQDVVVSILLKAVCEVNCTLHVDSEGNLRVEIVSSSHEEDLCAPCITGWVSFLIALLIFIGIGLVVYLVNVKTASH